MNWKMRGRVFGLVLLSVNFVAANAGYSVGPAQASPPKAHKASQTHLAAIASAEEKARVHLSTFLDFALDDKGRARQNAALKIVVTGYGGDPETIWVTPFAKRDGRYVGLLANEPKSNNAKRAGDAIAFETDQVRDWYFFGDDGKMYGSYTTRALLPEMAPKTARQISQILSATPAPAHW